MNPYLAEFIGTGLLLLLGTGVVANVVLAQTKGNGSGWIVITAGWGFAVFVAVAFAGQYSGAHINPAVTLALAISGTFGDVFTGWSVVPGYIGAQLAGAFVGSALAFLAYYKHFAATEDGPAKLAAFSTGPAIRSHGWNTFTEIVGTFVLVYVVLYLQASGSMDIDGESVPVGLGSVGAVPVGLLVFCIGLCLGGPTGYAINPARDLGPRIAHAVLPIPGKGSSDWGYAWVPVIGPIIGAGLAALLMIQIGG